MSDAERWGSISRDVVDPREHFVVDLGRREIVAGPYDDPDDALEACPSTPGVMAFSEGMIDLLNLCSPTELSDARGEIDG